MKIDFRILASFVFVAVIIVSCKKETNKPEENDNEVITTIEVKATEQGTNNTVTFKWEDLDGEGDAPVIDPIVLDPNKIYDVELTLLDKTKNPVVNTTEEIAEESVDHRFYFEPSLGTGITVSGFNTDDNSIALGTESVWTTTSLGTGTIKIILRHYPEGGKEASDPVNSSKSSTDAEVHFNVTVDVPLININFMN